MGSKDGGAQVKGLGLGAGADKPRDPAWDQHRAPVGPSVRGAVLRGEFSESWA